MIMKRVGATVTDFFDNFSNTTCTERISSVVDAKPGGAPLQLELKLSYVALLRPGKKGISLEEYRTNSKGEPAKVLGSIVTSGFVSLISYFHPIYQRDSRFRYLGRELIKGKDTYVIAFAQVPGMARQAVEIRLGNKKGYVLLQGVAWIDPTRFRILRLWTELEQPDPNLGLQKEITEVEYSEVAFKQNRKMLWLPREVTVNGQLQKVAFSNQHRYSQYRLFAVETGEKKKKT